MDGGNKGKQADLLDDENPRNRHEFPRKKKQGESPGHQGNGPVKPGQKIFIGDSALPRVI